MQFRKPFLTLSLLALLPGTALAQKPQIVANFYGPMLTGITVSHTGRLFVNYPHWGDKVDFTVAEIKNGRAVAYPNAAINQINKKHPENCLYSVQSVVVDPKDRLWALDTGSVKLMPSVPGGPKLVCIDLASNKITRIIRFSRKVVPAASYLNDIRFDLRRGKKGMAFITDSGAKAPNGIIVVDLATGQSWRRLGGHPSVKTDLSFTAMVDGQTLLERMPGNKPKKPGFASDGIAISNDGKRLFYCPVQSRHLFSVSVDALADRSKSEAEVASTVRDLGIKGVADGLETDHQGRIYFGDEEHALMRRGRPGGPYTTLARVAPMYWLDTLSVAANGYLYFTANELELQGRYHFGKDLRVKPYKLYRVRINAQPVLLR